MVPALAAAWQRLIAPLAWRRRTPQHLPAAETAAALPSTPPNPAAPESSRAGPYGGRPAEPADHEAVTPVSPAGDGQADAPIPASRRKNP